MYREYHMFYQKYQFSKLQDRNYKKLQDKQEILKKEDSLINRARHQTKHLNDQVSNLKKPLEHKTTIKEYIMAKAKKAAKETVKKAASKAKEVTKVVRGAYTKRGK